MAENLNDSKGNGDACAARIVVVFCGNRFLGAEEMGLYHRIVFALAAGCVAASGALATGTVTYTYDAKGRLVKVARSGSVNNGVNATYEHDKVDNRKRVVVTGSTGTPP